jgi:ABC-type bacteriocin/lantibiotic exporter with double-glycine peptidase domain
MLSLYSFKLWVEYILQIKLLKLREELGKDLQLKLIRRMKFLPYHEIAKDSKEGFYSDILRNINTVKSIIDQRMMGILKSFFSLVFGLFLIYIISDVLFFLLIIFFAMIIPFIIHKQRNLRDIEKKFIENFGKFLQIILDPIRKIYHLKIWNLFDLMIKKSVKRIDDLIKVQIEFQLFFKKLSNLQLILTQVGQILVFFASAYLLLNSQMTIGQLLGVNYYYGILSGSVVELLSLSLNWQQITVALHKLSEVLDDEEWNSVDDKIPIKQIKSLKFKNVCFKYNGNDSSYLLNNINFSVKSGEILGIKGRNGSGKTTLIKLLAGLYVPNEGRIVINSNDIEKYDIFSIRNRMAVCSQERYFIDGSILENLILDSEYHKKKLNDILQKCNLSNFINNLSESIHTILDSDRNSLSGGYQQRLELARALYKNPDILIIDESLSHVDSETKKLYRKILNSLRNEGKIIIFISHDKEWDGLFDKVLELS